MGVVPGSGNFPPKNGTTKVSCAVTQDTWWTVVARATTDKSFPNYHCSCFGDPPPTRNYRCNYSLKRQLQLSLQWALQLQFVTTVPATSSMSDPKVPLQVQLQFQASMAISRAFFKYPTKLNSNFVLAFFESPVSQIEMCHQACRHTNRLAPLKLQFSHPPLFRFKVPASTL